MTSEHRGWKLLAVLLVVGLIVALSGGLQAAQILEAQINSSAGSVVLSGPSWPGTNYQITGSGGDIWGGSDGLEFAYQEFGAGDALDISAQVGLNGFSGGTNGWRKAGVMIRNSLDANSRNSYTLIAENNGNGINAQIRKSDGAGTNGSNGTGPRINHDTPVWLRLEYLGDGITFKNYWSDDPGAGWNLLGTNLMNDPLTGTIYMGLAVTAHNNSQQTTVDFGSVTGFLLPNPPAATSAASASWNDAGTWSPAGVPTIDTPVTIDGNAVSLNTGDAAGSAFSLDMINAASLDIQAGQSLTLVRPLTGSGALTLGDGASLNLGSGGTAASVTYAGTATLGGGLTLDTLTDGGAAATLVKGGDGTLKATNLVAQPGTQFKISGGTLAVEGATPLDQSTQAVLLDGGKIDIKGPIVFVPGLMTAGLAGNMSFAPNDNNMGIDPLGPSLSEITSKPPWQDNWTVAYTGQIHIGPSGAASFRENIDDKTWLVVDGVKLLDDSGWNNATAASITRPEGWYDFELRMSNGGGGAGAVGGLGFGYSPTDTVGDTNQALYAPPQNTDAATADLFRTGSVQAIAQAGMNFVVTQDSEIHSNTPLTATYGTVTLKNGIIRTSGAATTFAGVVIDPAATRVGIAPESTTNYGGPIDGGGVGKSAFVFQTGADVELSPASAIQLANMNNASIGPKSGTLRVVGAAAWAGATKSELAGGRLEIFAAAPTPTAAPAGAEAIWRFEEGTGTTTANISGSVEDHTGTLKPGADWTLAGKVGNGIHFDGGYVDLPDGFADFTTGISVAAWVKTEAFTNWARVIDFGNGAGVDNILLARRGTGSGSRWEFHDTPGGGETKDTNNVFKLDEWQHLVATADAGTTGTNDVTMKLYLNGVEIGSWTDGSVPANVTRTNNFIGKSNWGGDALFQGIMDEMYIYKRALTQAEVDQLYDNGVGFTAPAIAMPTHDFTITGDSELFAGTTSTADFGGLSLKGGVVSVQSPGTVTFNGAVTVDVDPAASSLLAGIDAQAATNFLGGVTLHRGVFVTRGTGSLSFPSTTIDPAATVVGIAPSAATDYGNALDASGTAVTKFIIGGGVAKNVAAYSAGAGKVALAGLAGRTVEVSGGVLRDTTGALAGSTDLVLSGGTAQFEGAVTVHGDALEGRWYAGGPRDDSQTDGIGDGTAAGGLLGKEAKQTIALNTQIHYENDGDFSRGDGRWGAVGFDVTRGRWDDYQTMFSGNFTAPVTGDYEFGTNRTDDRGRIYVDLNQNGVFETAAGEQIVRRNCCGNSFTGGVHLEAGQTYAYAAVHHESGGGSNIEPTIDVGGGRLTVNPGDAAQTGWWSWNEYGALALGAVDVTVTADSALLARSSTADFGALSLQGASLTVGGASDRVSFATTTVDGGGGINATSPVSGGPLTINSGVLATGGSPVSFDSTAAGDGQAIGVDVGTKTELGVITGLGAGPTEIAKSGSTALFLDKTNVNLAGATWKVQQGVLGMKGLGPWGGSTSANLAGGTLLIEGQPTVGAGPGGEIGYWSFDNIVGGKVVNDGSAGAVMDGTFVTDARVGAPGVSGAALTLAGEGDAVDLGNDAALNFTTGDWGISAWVNTTQTGTGDFNKGTIFNNGGDTGGGIRYSLIVSEQQEGKVTILVDDNNAAPGSAFNKQQQPGATAVNDGNWHHVVGTREGGELRLYVDGVLDATKAIDPTYDLTGIDQHNAFIGADTDHPTGDDITPSLYKYFRGRVDEVKLYDKALSDADVAAMYGAPAAISMTTHDITVSASSTLQAGTAASLALGALSLNSGTLTTTGAPISFTGTTLAAAKVGVNLQVPTTLGPITGPGAGNSATFTKTGPADLDVADAMTGMDDSTVVAGGGNLILRHDGTTNPVGAAELDLGGGNLILSTKAPASGSVTYDNAVVVDADGALTAGQATTGVAAPMTVNVGSAANGMTVNAKVDLSPADGYALNVAGDVSGGGTATVSSGTVTLNGASNSLGTVDVSGGSLTFGAGTNTAGTLKLGGGTVDAGAGVEVTSTMKRGDATFAVSGNSMHVTGADLSATTNVRLPAGKIDISIPAVPTSGLLGAWSFDDATADDISGHGYNGTLIGSPTFEAADTAFPGSAGSINFNGGKNAVYVNTDLPAAPDPNQDVFDVDQITVAAWVKEWPDGSWEPWIAKRGEGGQGWQLRRRGGSGTDMTFTMRGPGNDDWGAATTINDGQWHHIAATYGGGKRRYYQDGVMIAEENRSGNINNTKMMLTFGARHNSGYPDTSNFGNFSHTFLDDVYIYDRPLTAGEIAALYSDGNGILPGPMGPVNQGTVNIAVEADAELASESSLVTLGNLSVPDVVTVTLTGAPFSFNNVSTGIDAQLTGSAAVRGTLDVGAAPDVIAALAANDLELATGSTFRVEIAGAFGDNDFVDVAGVLTLPKVDPFTIDVQDAGAEAAGGLVGEDVLLMTYNTFSWDTTLTGDVNGDNTVNDEDLNLLLSAIGSAAFDIDGDGGNVDTDDVTALLAQFGDISGAGTIDNATVVLPPGWTAGDVTFDSDLGELVLTGVNAPAAGPLSVPEPGTLVLLLLGALGLAPLARRLRK